MTKKTEKPEMSVMLKAPNFKVIEIHLKAQEGVPLIQQRQDPQVAENIGKKQSGETVVKEHRNFDEEFHNCHHWINEEEGTIGHPVGGFMQAILFVADNLGLKKTEIKRNIQIISPNSKNLIPFEYERIERVVDIPREGGMSKHPTIRHRPYIYGWKASIPVQYNADRITPEEIMNLFAHAGLSSGIGAWRPSSPNPGVHGLFVIDRSVPMKVG